jgi:hypothetical protein
MRSFGQPDLRITRERRRNRINQKTRIWTSNLKMPKKKRKR